jgi:cellulose biosynthesis protein BcsQ
MNNVSMCFFDTNVEYITRLSQYLTEKYINYDIVFFTDIDKFHNFCLSFEGTGIFIIADYCLDNEIVKCIKNDILLLVDERNIASVNDYYAIYRYQATDNIVSSILNYYAEKVVLDNRKKYIVKDDCKIIGIYSPINRCGKTSLSINLANLIKEEVLLINLEEFSEVLEYLHIESEFNLSDLMYFFLKNTDNLSIKLEAVVKKRDNFYIIPPLDNPEDLYDISTDIWVDFILGIRNLGRYKCIILDISNVVRECIQIFEICSHILVPYIDDRRSMNKMNKFDAYVNSRAGENSLNKIHKVNMGDENSKDIALNLMQIICQ